MYPGLSLRVTKRDAASAIRWRRLHPALSLVMVAEFPSDHVHLKSNLAFFYLALPFGWNGSPSHFARFGDSVTSDHRRCGLSAPNTLMRHSFRPVLYADGGIFVEINSAERLRATTQCWERLMNGDPWP